MREAMRSLKSLALEVGVSVATISNALNHKGKVSAPLRAKILKLAKKYHYQPSAHARVLHGQRMPVLGIIVPSMHDGLGQGFFQGADRAAREQGYSSILSISNHEGEDISTMELEAVGRFDALRIGGVLYLPSGSAPDDRVEQELARLDLPFAFIYRQGKNLQAPAITVDHSRGFHLLFDHLEEYRHQRIGIVLAGPEAKIMRNVFRERTRHADWESWIVHEDESNLNVFLQKKPTALITPSDDSAFRLARHLRAVGKAISEDISLVGYRDTIVAQTMTPSLTTVHVPTEEIGYAAADWLIRRIRGETGEAAPLHLQIPPRLVVRASTRRLG